MPKVPYPYEVDGKLLTGNGSLIPIFSLIIKQFLNDMFDCILQKDMNRFYMRS